MSQDGGYCCAPIIHYVSSLFPCQLSHKSWFSSERPAALARLCFLWICTEGDLSGQRGSVSTRFTHRGYWWLQWSWAELWTVLSTVQRCLFKACAISVQGAPRSWSKHFLKNCNHSGLRPTKMIRRKVNIFVLFYIKQKKKFHLTFYCFVKVSFS